LNVGQIARFLAVGMMNTLLDLLLLNIFTLISGVKDGLGYSFQKACSGGIAILFSYVLNKKWAFKSGNSGRHYIEFSKFIAISLFSMVIQVIVATVMVSYVRPLFDMYGSFLADAQLWVNIGGISGSLFSAISNFLGYKFYVFERYSKSQHKKVVDIRGSI
jgi:putative flippase GtrA